MNKFKFGTIAVLALVTVLATATMVSAQTATPPTPQDGTGNGFNGGRGSQQGMQGKVFAESPILQGENGQFYGTRITFQIPVRKT